jgi:hypothetical protein
MSRVATTDTMSITNQDTYKYFQPSSNIINTSDENDDTKSTNAHHRYILYNLNGQEKETLPWSTTQLSLINVTSKGIYTLKYEAGGTKKRTKTLTTFSLSR